MPEQDRKMRVRFAPSPTGPLHIGGVRTALYNYLLAKKNGGDFILRIEDTDQTRFVPDAEEYIIESLKWCGIEPNEGVGFGDGKFAPYRQSDRKQIYRQYAEQMVESGNAYYAFDTPEELEQMRERLKISGNPSPQYNAAVREYMKNSLTLSKDEVKSRIANGEPHVIRIKVPRKEEIKFHDRIRGWVSFHSNMIDDKILLKTDGMPTYHLAHLVDDYLMQITLVIRGEEWLPSAPVHILTYRALGWENVMPEFAHLPLILKPDGNGKLSKRDGDRLGFPVYPLQWTDPETKETSMGFREKGFFPEALINFLALLGWHPGGNEEIFSMNELIEKFSVERIGKSGAKFDYEKAKFFNQHYLKKQSNAGLAKHLSGKMKEHNLNFSNEYVEKICGAVKEKCIFLNDLWNESQYFFIAPKQYDEKVLQKKWNENSKMISQKLMEKFQSLNEWSLQKIESAVKELEAQEQKKVDLQLLRVLVTGVSHGAMMFQTLEILGKEEVMNRMEKALASIK